MNRKHPYKDMTSGNASENLRQLIPAVMIYKNRKNHWATEKGGE